ncbi:hypothetical protein [Hubei virga-like virus 16]|uniref:hypothetical protein n=1 Tax=Hubei virga-like virus 16 TaxID=1923331 RepID=UPI00090AFB10|nr:hypothetical protein [Hubei virga-like virus 16]APG77524.1 hypothetical protein [Hubei virga-like virus 16]
MVSTVLSLLNIVCLFSFGGSGFASPLVFGSNITLTDFNVLLDRFKELDDTVTSLAVTAVSMESMVSDFIMNFQKLLLQTGTHFNDTLIFSEKFYNVSMQFNSLHASILTVLKTLELSTTKSANLSFVKTFLYGPKGIAYSIPKASYQSFKRPSSPYVTTHAYTSLFAGLLGDIERLVVNSFVYVLKAFLQIFIDSLKLIVDELLRVLRNMLPVFERLVLMLVDIVQQLLKLLTELFDKLNEQYFMVELVIVFGLCYYFTRDIYITIGLFLIFFSIFDLTK